MPFRKTPNTNFPAKYQFPDTIFRDIEYSISRDIKRKLRCMKLTDDLRGAKWMYLKAFLFGVIGAVCVVALLIEYANWRDAILLFLAIWSCCRLYYFAFYVVEKYVDASFRFAGIDVFLVYLLRKKR